MTISARSRKRWTTTGRHSPFIAPLATRPAKPPLWATLVLPTPNWARSRRRWRYHQEAGARQAQPGMGHPMEEPQQGGAFQCPADSDPLAVELYRENQGDEEQCHAAKPGRSE